VQPEPVNQGPVQQNQDQGFMDFLNNYDNNNPVQPEPVNQGPVQQNQDPGFMDFLNNYDNNNPVQPEPVQENPGFNENIYSNFNADNNDVLINDVTPPITSNFSNQYIEDNPNYVDVSKQTVIDNVDAIIDRLKDVINDIKASSKFKIDTDEINYDDLYQITIKIDKRDY